MARPVSATARWLPGLLVAATLLAWYGSLSGAFVFDDLSRIVRNPEIHSLEHPARLLRGTSRPLLKLSLALNYAVGGEQVLGYHLVNLAIHVLAGLALFGVVRRTLLACAPRAPWAGGAAAAPWLAAAVALLWLLHPLQTQAVTYVVQRGESLMGLAALGTLYSAIRCAGSRRPAPWGAAAVLCCAIGMGSKEVMVVVPPLVLLYDRSFLSGSFSNALRERWTLHAGLAATWLVPFGWIGVDTLFHGEFARPEIPTPSALAYGLTQPRILLHYLRLAIWPSPLCFDYQWPPATRAAEYLPAALLVGAALLASAWLAWRGSWLGFLGACFFAILAPTSSFVPLQDLAVEHRMYLPLAAVLALVVLLVYRALAPAGRWRPWLGGALVACAATALGLATAARNRDYRDELRLWRSVVAAAPGNARAYYNLGTILRQRGELDAAIAAQRRSLELAPDRARTHYNLANALKQRGDLDEAIAHYRRAIQLSPAHVGAHLNLANTLRKLGREEEAIAEYRVAVEADPGDPRARYNLAAALAAHGDVEAAIAEYRQVLVLRPAWAAAHSNLADALRESGDLASAIREYRIAVKFEPRRAGTHHRLGLALEESGARQEALEEYRKALAIEPEHAGAREHLETAQDEDES